MCSLHVSPREWKRADAHNLHTPQTPTHNTDVPLCGIGARTLRYEHASPSSGCVGRPSSKPPLRKKWKTNHTRVTHASTRTREGHAMVLRLRARMRDAEACHTPLPPHPQTATAAQRETGVIFCCTQGPHHPMYTVPTLVHTVNIGKLRHLTPPLRTSERSSEEHGGHQRT